ncbi:Beige/BEACH domain containing protein [Entamoeba histolytica HM-3:IMSS]|uniref:Beige/BEACH domain containing protein n=1 Tax=Entamoeba histolytica HM-3:IMSS TaxID=885315 RepID=M7WJB3_ENTHI|nr:Beige/BEACH domain containing protein [Entamoeba histolytica HM-3:IMSS]
MSINLYSNYIIGIKTLCGIEYDPDIPIDSFVYLIEGDLLLKLQKNKEISEEVFGTLSGLISNPVNASLITKEIIKYIINQLKHCSSDHTAYYMIDILSKRIGFYLDMELVKEFMQLYSLLPLTQSSQLTQSLVHTLSKKNIPRIYYSFTGFGTSINCVLSINEWPKESSIYHTTFRPTKFVEGNTPLIFSFSTNSYEISLCINTQNHHLILKTDCLMSSGYEKKMIMNNRMSMTRVYDTQIPIMLNEWYSIYLLHKNDGSFQIQCNGYILSNLTVSYPNFLSSNIVLLQIGGDCDKPGFCFVGDITGFQWYYNYESIESVQKFLTNNIILRNDKNTFLAVQISPLKSMIIGDKPFYKIVTTVKNQSNKTNIVNVCSSKINSSFSPVYCGSLFRIDDIILRIGGIIPFCSLLHFGFSYEKFNTSNIPSILQLLSAIFKRNEILRNQCEEINFYNIILQFLLSNVNKGDIGCAVDYLSICVRLFTSSSVSISMKKNIVRYIFDIGYWIGKNKGVNYPYILRKLIPPTTFVTLDLFKYITYEQLIMYIIADEEKMDIMPIDQWLIIKYEFIQYCTDIIIRCNITKYVENIIFVLTTTKSSSVIILLLYSIVCIICTTNEPPELLKHCVSIFITILNTNNPYIFCNTLKILYLLLGETTEILNIVKERFERIDMIKEVYDTVIQCCSETITYKLDNPMRLEQIKSIKYPTILINFINITFLRIIESTSEEELTTIILKDYSQCKRNHSIFSIISINEEWESTFYLLLDFLHKKKDEENMKRLMTILSNIILESFHQCQTSFLTNSIMKLHSLFKNWKDLYEILFEFFKIFLITQPFVCEYQNVLIIECGTFLSFITCGMFNYGRNKSTFHFDEQFNLISEFINQIDVTDYLKQMNYSYSYFEELYPIYYYFNINLIISQLWGLVYKKCNDISLYLKLFEMLCVIFPCYPLKRNHTCYFNWFLYTTTLLFNQLELNQEDIKKLENYQLNCIYSIQHYNNQLYNNILIKRKQIIETTSYIDLSMKDSIAEFYDSLMEAYHSIQTTIQVEQVVFNDYNVAPLVKHKSIGITKTLPKFNERILFNTTKYKNDIIAFREKELIRFTSIEQKFINNPFHQNEDIVSFDLKGFNIPSKPIFNVKKYHSRNILSIQERFIIDQDSFHDIQVPFDAEIITPCLLICIEQYYRGMFFIKDNSIHIKIKTHWYERPFSKIIRIVQRHFKDNDNAIEIFSLNKKPLFIMFFDQQNYQTIFTKLTSLQLEIKGKFSVIPNLSKLFLYCSYTKDWVEGKITTYEYLCQLNYYSGRSLIDISQYYIFPWITTTFDKPFNQIYNNTMYIRNFSHNRCYLQQGYFNKNGFKFGPLPATAIPLYLNQIEPYTTLYSLFESHFHCSKNIFSETLISNFNYSSIPYQKLQNITQINAFEFPYESIPQFYSCHWLFTPNEHDFTRISFPKIFANNSKQFILYHRMLLESPRVSEEMHKWFEMIFGKKMNEKSIPENCKKNFQSKFKQLIGQQPQLLFKTHPKRKKSFDYSELIKAMNNEQNNLSIDIFKELNQRETKFELLQMMDNYIIIKKYDEVFILNFGLKKIKKVNWNGIQNKEINTLMFYDGDETIGTIYYCIGYSTITIIYKNQQKDITTLTGSITSITLKEVNKFCIFELEIGTCCGELECYKIIIDKEVHEIQILFYNKIIISSNPLTNIISLPLLGYSIIQSKDLFIYSNLNEKIISKIHCKQEPLFVCASSNGNIYYTQTLQSSIEIHCIDINGYETGIILLDDNIISLNCICCTFVDFILVGLKTKVLIYFNNYYIPLLIHTLDFNTLLENFTIKNVIVQPSSLTTSIKENWIFIVQCQEKDHQILRSFVLNDVKLISL